MIPSDIVNLLKGYDSEKFLFIINVTQEINYKFNSIVINL